MQLSMTIPYTGDITAMARLVAELESVGLDLVCIQEAYSFDAISAVGYLAALTHRVEIGTAVVNVFSRTAALLGMTAAGCDAVSEGRFFLGLGASGPQVIEGFHGMPYEQPLTRTLDTIDIVRKVLRRETLDHVGRVLSVPLPDGEGIGLGRPLKLINRPVRAEVPIWWASLMPKAVEKTAEIADGWIPAFFIPERASLVWGESLARGRAKRSSTMGQLRVLAGGPVAVGDDAPIEAARAAVRRQTALYVGGMGARGKNFYNTICQQYGWADEAARVQDLYLAGRKREAEQALPHDLVDALHLCGPVGFVRERIAAYREAGVTALSVEPIEGVDTVRAVAAVRALVDE